MLDASTRRLVTDKSQVTTSQGGQVPVPHEDTREIAGLVQRAPLAHAVAGYTHPVLDVPASCRPGRDERHGVCTILVVSQRQHLFATTQDLLGEGVVPQQKIKTILRIGTPEMPTAAVDCLF